MTRVSSAIADPLWAQSCRVLQSRIDLSVLPPLKRAVTETVLCATADFDYVTDLACKESALAAGVRALAAGAPVVADVATVAAGITELTRQMGVPDYPVICKSAEPLAPRLARTTGITVPAAGIRLGFGEAGPGAVWVVGGAADALAEVMRRVALPALVIGVPVGLVGAAEVKDALRASDIPSLTCTAEKGGPIVAAAALAALLQAAAND